MGTRDQELVPHPLPVLELCRRLIAQYRFGLTPNCKVVVSSFPEPPPED